MASSVSVGIVGEGPSADSVMSWDRLIDNSTAGGEERKWDSGRRSRETLFLFHSLAPNCSQCQRHGPLHRQMARRCVCSRVCVCVGWWRHSALYKCKRWRGRDIRGGTEEGGKKHCRGVCDFIMQSLIHVLFSFLSFFFILHVGLACLLHYSSNKSSFALSLCARPSYWVCSVDIAKPGTSPDDDRHTYEGSCGCEEEVAGRILYWQTAIYWILL